MNDKLQKFARQTLKSELAELPLEMQYTFKLMYGRKVVKGRPTRSIEDLNLIDINAVVDEIPEERLD